MPPHVPTSDPFLEFPTEVVPVPTSPVATPAPWPLTQKRAPAVTHAVDATSRVVSFVLGFALASVFAWLGTISSDDQVTRAQEVSAAPKVESVAPAVEPVVAAATVVAPAVPATPPPPPKTTVPTVRAAAPPPPVEPPSPQQRKREAVSGYRGALVLNSIPSGAEVVLNGRVIGQTPIVLEDQPAGSRGLVLRREGYAPWSTAVRVVADQRTMVRATLTAVRP